MADVDMGATQVRWRRGFSESDQTVRSVGSDVLALSAFHLSSLPTPLARKDLIKQIWSSGANVIVSQTILLSCFVNYLMQTR